MRRPLGLFLLPFLLVTSSTACVTDPPPVSEPDAGTPDDGGVIPDAGEPGEGDGGAPDAGPPVDGGEPACAAWLGDTQLGSELDDVITGLTGDTDGNLYAVGYRRGEPGGGRFEPGGDAEAVIHHFDARGELVWTRALDTKGADSFEGVLLDEGRLYLVGRTTGAISGATNAGQQDVVVGRMDPRVDSELELVQYGDERPQHPRALVRAANGSLAVAGFNDVYVPTNYVEAWEDPFLSFIGEASPSAPLVVDEDLRFDSPASDRLLDIARASDGSGDVFVAGHIEAGESKGAFVRRLGADGKLRWQRVLSPIGFDMVSALQLLEDGTLLAAGTTAVPIGPHAYGGQDAFAVWLDPETGETKQAAQAGGLGYEWVLDAAVDARGHVFIAGSTSSDLVGPNRGDADVFVIEIDDEGRWVGSFQHGTSKPDEANAVFVDACGRVRVAGYTDAALVEEQHQGNRDAILIDAVLTPRTPEP